MTKQLRFEDHVTFHRQVLRLTLAGGALWLLGYLVATLFDFNPAGSTPAEVLRLLMVAAVLGLAASPPVRRGVVTTGLLAVGVSLLAALAFRVLSPPAYPWFGVFIYGLAVGVIAGRDLRDHRRWTLPAATGLSVMLATWVVAVLVARLPLTEYVPAVLAEPLYGATFGFLVALGLVARQIRLERDKVLAGFEQMRGALSGEILELCERGIATYRRIKDALRDREDRGDASDPKLTRGVESLMLKIVALGRRWQQVEREASRTSADTVVDRVAGLDDKIAQAQDAVARRQYVQARDALQAQLGYLRDISRSRERVTARVHNYLAALERLHLAVLNHQSADAAKFSDELQPILDEIDDCGVEMDIASEALTEAAEAASSSTDQAADPTDAGAVTAHERETVESEALAEVGPPAPGVEASGDPETALLRSAFGEPRNEG